MKGQYRCLAACTLIDIVAAMIGPVAATAPPPGPTAASSAQTTQKFVCERGFVNFASGYQSAGIYVDGEGHVYHYQFESGAKPWLPKKPAVLTEEELEAKYIHGRKLFRTVDAKELAAMIPLIAKASQGPYSKLRQTACDAGALVSTCYLYNPATGRYHGVKIEQEGDFSYKNLSPAADTLARWLVSLDPQFR